MRIFILLMLISFQAMAGDLPDPKLTPGALSPKVVRKVSVRELCSTSTRAVRDVPAALNRQVYKSYDMSNHAGGCKGPEGCEMDHLCSLELGCNNDPLNLWPQPYSGTKWNAHVKDRYENFLHRQVCLSRMSLRDAQIEISTDWIKGYLSHPELTPP